MSLKQQLTDDMKAAMKAGEKDRLAVIPVSYTHLDVYKRQTMPLRRSIIAGSRRLVSRYAPNKFACSMASSASSFSLLIAPG